MKARQLLADGNWLVVAGYFDPLTASVAQRLRDLVDRSRDETLLAVVLDGSQTILTAEARSYLIAALRTVDAVLIMAEEELSSFEFPSPRVRFVFNREAERRNSADFEVLVSRKERLHLHPNEGGS